MASSRVRHFWGCLGYSSVVVAAAVWVLLSAPGELIGEGYQASAAKQYRMGKIHSWLLSQERSVGMAAHADRRSSGRDGRDGSPVCAARTPAGLHGDLGDMDGVAPATVR